MSFECVNKTSCPACSRKNAITRTTCMYCGATLGMSVAAESVDASNEAGPRVAAPAVSCAQCARPLKGGASRCLYCGYDNARGRSSETRICPRCEVGMRGKRKGWATVDICQTCAGEFYDAEELYAAGAIRSDEWRWLARHFRPCPHDTGDAEALACPGCQSPMETVQVVGKGYCVVNRCAACRGLWLDAGEVARLQAIVAGRGAHVDNTSAPGATKAVGQPRHCRGCGRTVPAGTECCMYCGRTTSTALGEDISRFCPRCDEEMTTVVAAVSYERCSRCQGQFYDDGELQQSANLSKAQRTVLDQRMSVHAHDSATGQALMCPGCDGPMVTYRLERAGTFCLIDRCPACKGMWLDQGEAGVLHAIVSGRGMSRESYGSATGAGRPAGADDGGELSLVSSLFPGRRN